MLDGISDAMLVAMFGFFGGIALGLAARIGRFCTLGAIEDFLYQGSSTRLRMWFLAIGVAGTLSFTLAAFGALDLSQTIYSTAPWSPLASITGGLLFGYGMSLAGNCGFGALARSGGGDLRSFVIVLVMGISAYAMLSGPFAAARVMLVANTTLPTPHLGYADLLGSLSGIRAEQIGLIITGAIALAALGSRSFLNEPKSVAWACAIGIAIVSGWAGTQWVATDRFGASPVLSHTFTAPLGETLIFLMTASGGGLSFGVGSVFGVLVGAFSGSLIKGHFRWEACEDPRELKRQFLGAICMGFGAVLAMGCTIGQGISAFSVLSFSAPLVLASIFAGAALGLKQLITGFAPPN
ncbi:YeeE/YedE family protein [Litoreibacter arenae]|uniref:Lipocalin-related protein and Bos/Can/Equ allergen n=1 Tax=Litoreibacter arenae DSM 19593 TaxID=1123360 RepID=S9QAP3_9RHOB|nr:YeeE/YedE family protein [Litoreibacter arenae]EPX77042.1 Lipocalin-related protein and Bos/Can/Equ allergen [Litoreibacter arenae DSM 19593]